MGSTRRSSYLPSVEEEHGCNCVLAHVGVDVCIVINCFILGRCDASNGLYQQLALPCTKLFVTYKSKKLSTQFQVRDCAK